MAQVLTAADNALARVADRWFSIFARLIIESLEPTLSLDETEALVRQGRFAEIIDPLALTRLTKAAKPETLLEAYVRVITEAAGTVSIPGVVTARLDMTSPAAVLWAYRLAAQLVTNVGAETKAAIRVIIARALAFGGAPRTLARDIWAVTGLDARSAQAVVTYRANLEAALMAGRQPAALRGRFSLAPMRMPAGAPADVEGRVDLLVDAYRKRLLRRRGENIARTELQTSVHRGAQLSWDQAMTEHPDLRPRARRVWVATKDGRTCARCASLDGQVIGYDEEFEGLLSNRAGAETGAVGQLPPLHPGSCRCTTALRFVD